MLVQHIEKQFWGRALKIADLNADGTLELHEFSLLMKACFPVLSTFCNIGHICLSVGHAAGQPVLVGISIPEAAVLASVRVCTSAQGYAHSG